MTTTIHHPDPQVLFGLDALETEVLLALALTAEGAALPITPDGRLARDAFGRDLDLEVLGHTPKGVRARERRGQHIAPDGAPSASVYRSLALMGLAQDSGGRCAWIATPTGRAIAAAL